MLELIVAETYLVVQTRLDIVDVEWLACTIEVYLVGLGVNDVV